MLILREFEFNGEKLIYLDFGGKMVQIPKENFKWWEAYEEPVEMVGDDGITAVRTNIEVVLRADRMSQTSPNIDDLLTTYAENQGDFE